MVDSFAALLPAVIDIAERAGRAILAVYDRDFKTTTKSDGSHLTEADLNSEAVILPALASLTPDIPTISEERVAAGHIPELAGAICWYVDPLDGTREFVSRNDEFCVSIGLIRSGAPVLGVLHGPALGVTYAAAGAGTAVRRQGTETAVAIAARAPSVDGLVAMVSRSHRKKSEATVSHSKIPVSEQRPMGSALKFGLIADGNADIYPRLGPTCEWDTAGGHAILEAAGGRIETLDGEPLEYGKPNFLNPGFIAFGRP